MYFETLFFEEKASLSKYSVYVCPYCEAQFLSNIFKVYFFTISAKSHH